MEQKFKSPANALFTGLIRLRNKPYLSVLGRNIRNYGISQSRYRHGLNPDTAGAGDLCIEESFADKDNIPGLFTGIYTRY
jgi:hypothetical protein